MGGGAIQHGADVAHRMSARNVPGAAWLSLGTVTAISLTQKIVTVVIAVRDAQNVQRQPRKRHTLTVSPGLVKPTFRIRPKVSEGIARFLSRNSKCLACIAVFFRSSSRSLSPEGWYV